MEASAYLEIFGILRRAFARPKAAIVCRKAPKPPAERPADRFAARIPMPGPNVRAIVRALHGDDPPSLAGLDASRESKQPSPNCTRSTTASSPTASSRMCSNEAMCCRLLDLKLVLDQAAASQGRLL